jgi:phosphohistidine phosphatase
MRIILFRHGPAETRDPNRWPDDSLRPLTPEGAEVTRRAARGVARMEPRITAVFSSPALRALDTARYLMSALELGAEPELVPSLAPEAAWRDALKWLSGQPADAVVALVGHQPGLDVFAGKLLGASSDGSLVLKKAGACSITCEVLEPGRGQLKWWLRPAALRAVKPFKSGRVA